MNTLVTFRRPLNDRFFSPMSAWRDFDNLAETFLRPEFETLSSDVNETKDHYLMSLDMPGVKKENLKIEFQENQIVITGQRLGRTQTQYRKMFSLPMNIEADKIEASLEDGVLNIVVPKAESAKPRSIEIKSGENSLWRKLIGSETQKSENGH